MDPPAADVLQIVEYSRDRWNVDRVPLAFLFCAAGMAFVVYLDPRPPGYGTLIAFVALMAAMMIIFPLSHFLFDQVFEGRTIAIRFIAALLLIPAWMILPSRHGGPNIPGYVLGWMMVMGAIGWISFALYRHFKPARPILALSPAGITYNMPWLKNLFIPWHEVRGVEALEIGGGSGVPHRFPDTTVILLSHEFYERHVLPKRGLLAGRGWDQMFVPKGPLIQMVLHFLLFAVEPKDIREPIATRWKAFRTKLPTSLPDASSIPEARQVYGSWSIDGSLWQAIKFLVPLILILGIVVDSTGILR